MTTRIYLNALGILTPLGIGKDAVAKALFAGSQDGMVEESDLLQEGKTYVGRVSADLPELNCEHFKYNSRNNRMTLLALQEIEADIQSAIKTYGDDRIAVVLGTSTSGIGDNESGISHKVETGSFPVNYHFERQETASISMFVQEYFALNGPALTISTACTSGAKALASACRMIKAGVCDAAIVGGCDSLCKLTLNGFKSLESLSEKLCQSFSKNRDGINIGEGGAFFLISKDSSPVEVAGIGETSDAHHISAPAPDGKGAIRAMEIALEKSEAVPNDVAYINLHGTATTLNDAMEAKAVSNVLGHDVACSSTKSLTGHMLGAAGAIELGFLWLTLQDKYSKGHLPPHIWDGEADDEIVALNFSTLATKRQPEKPLMLSNSFAFGGNNICVALRGGS